MGWPVCHRRGGPRTTHRRPSASKLPEMTRVGRTPLESQLHVRTGLVRWPGIIIRSSMCSDLSSHPQRWRLMARVDCICAAFPEAQAMQAQQDARRQDPGSRQTPPTTPTRALAEATSTKKCLPILQGLMPNRRHLWVCPLLVGQRHMQDPSCSGVSGCQLMLKARLNSKLSRVPLCQSYSAPMGES